MPGLLSGQSGSGGGGTVINGYLDVTQSPYNADPTGVADCRAAISAAETARAAVGGELYFPPGTYRLTAEPGIACSLLLLDKTNVYWRGVPGESILKHDDDASGSQTSCQLLRIAGCTNVVIRDLTFDGNWGNAVTSVRVEVGGFETYVDLAALPSNTLGCADTSKFPSSGSFTVVTSTGAQVLTYTGKTATTFTGVSAGTGIAQGGDKIGYVDKLQKTTSLDASMNALSLPQGTITVASTTGFPASATAGLVQVQTSAGVEGITYTSKNATQFLGCTGGTGTMSTGGLVQYVFGAINQIGAPMQVDPKNHLVMIYGSNSNLRDPNHNITLDGCQFKDAYGDFVWVGAWSYDVHINNCHGDLSARNGVTLSYYAERVNITGCSFRNTYTSAIDSEPVEGPTRDITIDDCDLGLWWNPYHDTSGNIAVAIGGGSTSRAAEWTNARNWTISNSRVEGSIAMATVRNIRVYGNTLRCDFAGTSSPPVLLNGFADDVEIAHNNIYSRLTATGATNRGAVNVTHYRLGAGVDSAQPKNILVRHNTILARNGQDGVYVEGAGGGIGATGTATGITAASAPSTAATVTDSGASWTTDVFSAHQIVMGGKVANIISNTGTVLTLAPLHELYALTSWATPDGRPTTAPSAGAYVIQPTGGFVRVEHNSIDLVNDGNGAGRYGVFFTSGLEWNTNFARTRWSASYNHVRGATGSAVRAYLYPGIAGPQEFRAVGNHAWDDQATQTCTSGLFLEESDQFGSRVIHGNTAGSGIPLVSGLTSGSWQTSDGHPASWAGYIDPEGVITASVASTYQRLDTSTLYIKETSDAFSTGWNPLRSALRPGVRGLGTAVSGTGSLSPGLPASSVGDIEILIVQNTGLTDPGVATLSTPARFVRKIETSSDGGFLISRGSIWWRRRQSGDVAPVVADSGAFNSAVIVAVKDCVGYGDPFDITGSSFGATQAVTGPAVTTTVDGVFMLNAITWFNGGNTGTIAGWTNPDLSEIAEVYERRFDIGSDDVAMAVMSGRVATATAVDATTATIDAPSYAVWCAFALALTPAHEPARASGTITCVAKASLADTDYLTIGDGVAVAKLYEFDTAGDGVTGGRVQVNVSTDTTSAEVAARLRTAILANQPTLGVTDNGDGTLTVTHNWPGAGGNVTMTENVANAGFLVSGLTGGQG